jgi:hypothetical protein
MPWPHAIRCVLGMLPGRSDQGRQELAESFEKLRYPVTQTRGGLRLFGGGFHSLKTTQGSERLPSSLREIGVESPLGTRCTTFTKLPDVADGDESFRLGTREARRKWRCLSLSWRGR